MASLKLSHIYKVYPNGVKAVNDFTMDIEDKEFIVFVGPSGCGKSTTLRMIAGLEQITSGELSIGDTIVNYVEPRNRDIAMVFQNYALYPHMTVYNNIAFGLKLRKIIDIKKDREGNPILNSKGETISILRHYTKEEIDAKVKAAAGILGITDYLNRKPRAMSGGQCQRVALGRAIVREPKVFLLDEPLSNLDAKLRTTMRSEINKLYHKLGTTFIYVTHDQVEAMTMGTRIVVMDKGCVQQIDTPSNLYKYPGNKFVAGFIGSPQMNFYEGAVSLKKDKVVVHLDGTVSDWEVPYSYFTKADKKYLDGNHRLIFGLRSEHISINPKEYPYKAKCCVSYTEELGTECLVYADFNIENAESIMETPTRIIIKAPADTKFERDEVIEISLDLIRLHIFDKETENNIAPRIPENVIVDAKVKKNVLTMLGSTFDLPPAMHTEDGNYSVTIPTTAIVFGNKVSAVIEKEEVINAQKLSHIKVGTTILFGLDLETKEKDVLLDIDLKQLSLSQEEVKINALNRYSSLTGKLVKVKDKADSKKEVSYKFVIENCDYECPTELVDKLLSSSGKAIFKKELEFRFSPATAYPAESGVPAQVEEILDYGNEKYAKCKASEKEILVKIDLDFNQSQINVGLDSQTFSIYEKERNLRLI